MGIAEWRAFVKEWGKRNNVRYICAISDPRCSEEYHAQKGDVISMPKREPAMRTATTQYATLSSIKAQPYTEAKKKFKVGQRIPMTPEAKRDLAQRAALRKRVKIEMIQPKPQGDSAVQLFAVPTKREKPVEPVVELRPEQLGLVSALPAGYVVPTIAPPPRTAQGMTETLLQMFESTAQKRKKPPSKYELAALEKTLKLT